MAGGIDGAPAAVHGRPPGALTGARLGLLAGVLAAAACAAAAAPGTLPAALPAAPPTAPTTTLLAAAVTAPALSLSDLPTPTPAAGASARAALVVPAQVARWRQEAASLEHGDGGIARDPARAAALYCRAAQYGDAEAQYSLAWMLTNARGIERDDAAAAHLFAAAAEQGHPQADNMARSLGTPRGQPPPCLQPPADEPEPPVLAAAPAGVRVGGAGHAVGVGQTGDVRAPGALPHVAPPRLPPNAPAPIVRFVELVAPEYQLEPHLVLAVMATESNFDPWAVSPKNARGLMQLIPDTARRFRVRDLTDPTENIRGGMAYLRWLLAYFEGDLRLALAAYNAGEGAVERYRGVPPFAETRLYVRKVQALIGGQHSHPFDPQVTKPSSVLPLMRR